MEDRLSAVGTGICDQAIASPGNPFCLGEFARDREKMTHQLLILRFEGGDRFDMLVRHDQDVGRRDGVRIPKGGHLFIVVDNCSFRFL